MGNYNSWRQLQESSGRYVIETIRNAAGSGQMHAAAIQEALDDGSNKGWVFVSVLHSSDSQFAMIWDKKLK